MATTNSKSVMVPAHAPDWAREHADVPYSEGQIIMMPLDRITPDLDQPRQTIDQEKLNQLTDNIREQHLRKRGIQGSGIWQPIIIRYPAGVHGQGGAFAKSNFKYIIVAGESRFNAALSLKLEAIPTVIEDLNEEDAYEVAYFENIQRTNLDPIDDAIALNRIKRRHRFSTERLAAYVNRSYWEVRSSLDIIKYQSDVLDMLAAFPKSGGLADKIDKVKKAKHRKKLIAMVYEHKTWKEILDQVKYFRQKEEEEHTQHLLATAQAVTDPSNASMEERPSETAHKKEPVIVSNFNLPDTMDSIKGLSQHVHKELAKVTITPQLKKDVRKRLRETRKVLDRIEAIIRGNTRK